MGKNTVIVLDQRLVKSRAWLSLTGAAPQVYLLFRTKCQISKRFGKPGRHERVIVNSGRIEFTYLEAEHKYGIKPSRFRRAIDELIEKGFIDVTATGMGVHKVKSCYGIADRWPDYGTSAFCEATRPEPSIANPGFKRGNKLWRMAPKKKTSVDNAHGAVREDEHGEAVTVCEDAHDERDAVSRKCRERKELSRKVAQDAAVRENDTVL